MTNSSSSRRALVVQNNFSPFGNALIQSGFVNQEQLSQALVQSRKTGKPLTEALELITGKALSPELLRQYKKQQLFELKILYGVESLDPEINQVSSNQMGELIENLVPIDLCRRYRLLPLAKGESEPPFVLVAMD
ncbi:MAG: type II/IV secretion system protein, partial [Alkalinema sp. RL_2_19]|nr:type II/IV secretion system protein [Alkalinema sp. RL_2_19]